MWLLLSGGWGVCTMNNFFKTSYAWFSFVFLGYGLVLGYYALRSVGFATFSDVIFDVVSLFGLFWYVANMLGCLVLSVFWGRPEKFYVIFLGVLVFVMLSVFFAIRLWALHGFVLSVLHFYLAFQLWSFIYLCGVFKNK